MTTRIYLVTDNTTGAKRLIRAAHQAQAVRHAARAQITVTVASQDDLVFLVADGHCVEDANASDAAADEQQASETAA